MVHAHLKGPTMCLWIKFHGPVLKTFWENGKKTLKFPFFYFFFVIKDPLKKKYKQKIEILLPQLLGQYCCAHSSQISEKFDENSMTMSAAELKKIHLIAESAVYLLMAGHRQVLWGHLQAQWWPSSWSVQLGDMALEMQMMDNPDSKVHGANMWPIWGRQDPGGSHVGPMNFAIWEDKN